MLVPEAGAAMTASSDIQILIISPEGQTFVSNFREDTLIEEVKHRALDFFYPNGQNGTSRYKMIRVVDTTTLHDFLTLGQEQVVSREELLLVERRTPDAGTLWDLGQVRAPMQGAIAAATATLPAPQFSTRQPNLQSLLSTNELSFELRKILISLVEAGARLAAAGRNYEMTLAQLCAALEEPQRQQPAVIQVITPEEIAARLRPVVIEPEVQSSTKKSDGDEVYRRAEHLQRFLDKFRTWRMRIADPPTPEALTALKELGFSFDDSDKALRTTGCNVPAAAAWLTGERGSSVFELVDGLPDGAILHALLKKVPQLFWTGGDVAYDCGFGCYAQRGLTRPIGAENYHFPHSMPGLLSMRMTVDDEMCGIFNVTFKPLPQLDLKNVVFGRVIRPSATYDALTNIGSALKPQPIVEICAARLKVDGQWVLTESDHDMVYGQSQPSKTMHDQSVSGGMSDGQSMRKRIGKMMSNQWADEKHETVDEGLAEKKDKMTDDRVGQSEIVSDQSKRGKTGKMAEDQKIRGKMFKIVENEKKHGNKKIKQSKQNKLMRVVDNLDKEWMLQEDKHKTMNLQSKRQKKGKTVKGKSTNLKIRKVEETENICENINNKLLKDKLMKMVNNLDKEWLLQERNQKGDEVKEIKMADDPKIHGKNRVDQSARKQIKMAATASQSARDQRKMAATTSQWVYGKRNTKMVDTKDQRWRREKGDMQHHRAQNLGII